MAGCFHTGRPKRTEDALHGVDRCWHDGVPRPAATSFDSDESRIVQDPHVMGDRRLGELEPRDDITGTYRVMLGGDQTENGKAGGITKCFELRDERVLRRCRQRQRDDRDRTTLGWSLSGWHDADDSG